MLLIVPIGIAVYDTFRRPGVQYHIPRSGTFAKLYVDICGNVAVDRHQWHVLSGDRLDEKPDVSRWDGIDVPPH